METFIVFLMLIANLRALTTDWQFQKKDIATDIMFSKLVNTKNLKWFFYVNGDYSRNFEDIGPEWIWEGPLKEQIWRRSLQKH